MKNETNPTAGPVRGTSTQRRTRSTHLFSCGAIMIWTVCSVVQAEDPVVATQSRAVQAGQGSAEADQARPATASKTSSHESDSAKADAQSLVGRGANDVEA